jgi:hypothetical protein
MRALLRAAFAALGVSDFAPAYAAKDNRIIEMRRSRLC